MREKLHLTAKAYRNAPFLQSSLTRVFSSPMIQVMASKAMDTSSKSFAQHATQNDIIRHSMLIGQSIRSAFNLYSDGSKLVWIVLSEIKKILDPIDLGFIIALNLLYKPILQGLFKTFKTIFPIDPNRAFKDSYFGFIEKPVKWHVRYYLPSLYLLDILTVIFGALHLTKVNVSNAFTAAKALFWSVIVGSYVIAIKDYFLNKLIRPSLTKVGVKVKDQAREDTINELTSLLIWIIVAYVNLESMSKTFGFGLGSVFALGGKLFLRAVINPLLNAWL
jgi:hypothetical protein